MARRVVQKQCSRDPCFRQLRREVCDGLRKRWVAFGMKPTANPVSAYRASRLQTRSGRNWKRQPSGRPTQPLHPTRGRSLARRFRGSLCATLRVALLGRLGRAPGERQNVRRTKQTDSVASHDNVTSSGLQPPSNQRDILGNNHGRAIRRSAARVAFAGDFDCRPPRHRSRATPRC